MAKAVKEFLVTWRKADPNCTVDEENLVIYADGYKQRPVYCMTMAKVN